MYDAQIGRFFTQDRFADKYLASSPYHYAVNNPILNIDFNGVSAWTTANDSETTTLHVTGTIVDMSKNKFTAEDLRNSAFPIVNEITEGFTSDDGSFGAEVYISVSSTPKGVKKSDHVFRIYDDG